MGLGYVVVYAAAVSQRGCGCGCGGDYLVNVGRSKGGEGLARDGRYMMWKAGGESKGVKDLLNWRPLGSLSHRSDDKASVPFTTPQRA
jgi:hypothetical protein